jgi:single-stranded-DNA-specific exonuclease
MKKWTVKKQQEVTSPVVSGISILARNVLAARGITDVEAAHSFFKSDHLHDSLLMKDMEKAVDFIKTALISGKKITVYGDYDCDGITATVMLYNYLCTLGGNVEWYIPSRDEGYGLNAAAIEKIAAGGTQMIITVDNGVSAHEEARLIQEKGISLIITDHHTCPENLPLADAIINPKQPGCEYPFKELAGCGVVLKLISALEDSDSIDVIEQYGDLAAIGTIADIVELTDENRHMVSLGLQSLEFSENIGLRCLMKKAGLLDSSGNLKSDSVCSQTMAFILCPRINAAGRFAHPGKAVELLLCENPEIAAAKAEELDAFNQQRIEEEKLIIAEIEAILQENTALLNERVLVLAGKDWHHGIIGIIASRMVSRFGKPCVIISTDGKSAKGSCRSVKGFSIHSMLKFCGDLLVKFGGHTGAGGLSVDNENIAPLTRRIQDYAAQTYAIMPSAEIAADSSPNACDITLENVEKLDMLQPFGEGNLLPIFCLEGCKIKHKRPLKEGKYTSFTIMYQNREFKVLDFSKCYADFWYKVGDDVDLMLNISLNEYNDSIDISVKAVDIRLCGITALQERYFAAKDIYERLIRGEEIDSKLYMRIVPEEPHMKAVYDIIKDSFCLDQITQKSMKAGVNYCMLRVILDVFEQVGLIEFNRVNGEIKTLKTTEKIDIEKSELLIKLKGKL